MIDLREMDELYFKVAEAFPDAIVVVNGAGEIVVFNEQAELMFDYERSEVLGRPLEQLLPEDRRDIHVAHRVAYFTNLYTREMGLGLDLKGRRRDGDVFPVEIKLAPIPTTRGAHVLAVIRRVHE